MILNERFTTYIDSLCWHLSDECKQVEREARENNVPIIRRSMQSLLAFFVHQTNPKTILEIGTAVGFSALCFAEFTKGTADIDTIERSPQMIAQAKKNFARFDTGNRIHLYEGQASDFLTAFIGENRRYDFIFMDAAKGQYLKFLPQMLALLAPGGLLVSDNVLQDGEIIESRYAIARRDRTTHERMREYLYTLTHTENIETLILPVGDGAAVSAYR